jgi:hypothetical protein
LTATRFAVLAAWSVAGSTAWSAEPAERFWASAAVVHRALEENAAGGARLLTERGPMLELRLGGHHALGSGGALASELSLAGGLLDYDGQTQGGAPLQTTADHLDAGARVMWRPWAPQPWGAPWLIAGWHHNRRNITGTGTVSGLREHSSAWLAGVRWQSASHQATAQWQMHLELDALVSMKHRLDVDFHGLFDASRLDGGRQRRTAIRLVGTAADSPWNWTLEWSRLNQAASPSAILRRGGLVAGTVRQPHLSTDDLALRVTRRF